MSVMRLWRFILLLVTLWWLLWFCQGYRPSLGVPLLGAIVGLTLAIALFAFAFEAPVGRIMLALGALVAFPVFGQAGFIASQLDFKYRRKAQYEARIAAIEESRQPAAGVQEVLVPSAPRVDAYAVRAEAQESGGLIVAFVWSGSVFGHRYYVYCAPADCAYSHLRLDRRLDERWYLASD
jgi:hypothetical protein